MVRQWIANPLSPVRIWVPPDIFNYNIALKFEFKYHISYLIKRDCGEIGRHDGLKTHCLAISVRVQVPPIP